MKAYTTEELNRRRVEYMTQYLRYMFDEVSKIDAIKALSELWPDMTIADKVKAYKKAYRF